MSKEIIAVLDDLAKRFGIAIDWTSKNVTPYLTELFEKFITWEMATSIAWICLSVIATVVTMLITIFLIKKDWEELGFYIGLLSISLFILTCFVVCEQTFDIIACKTFPEKILFDYAANYLEIH